MARESLSELLAGEIAGIEQFCALLTDEQKALTGGTAERLQDIAAQKSALAIRLGQLEAARDGWLQQAGHDGGKAGMQAYLAGRPVNAPELTLWQKLLDLAAKAKAGNDTNGKLIALLLRQNQEALSALLANGDGSVYGPDGQPRTPSGGRSFGAV